MMHNILDCRELMTGKDGQLMIASNGINQVIAEVNEYSVVMNVESNEHHPIGSLLTYHIPQHVSFELTFTEMVVRDDFVIKPLLEAMNQNLVPEFHFQGAIEKSDGSEQRITFNNAVPNGTFDLQTITPGEVIERKQSFALNSIPQFISSLASNYKMITSWRTFK